MSVCVYNTKLRLNWFAGGEHNLDKRRRSVYCTYNQMTYEWDHSLAHDGHSDYHPCRISRLCGVCTYCATLNPATKDISRQVRRLYALLPTV